MARGWESKGIEEQQAAARTAAPAGSPRTSEQISQQRQLDALRLSRSRVVQQLEATQNPHYRKTLEAALAELERQMASQNGAKV